jgi:hypothetical protein
LANNRDYTPTLAFCRSLAKLTIARAEEKGQLTVVAQVPTPAGARNATVAKDGTVFLAHGGQAQISGLVVVTPSGK